MTGRRRALRLAGVAVIVCALSLTGVTLERDLRARFQSLATARSDNLQWVLSQVEVEYLVFGNAILRAEFMGAQELDSVRQRFDILFSRLQTLRRSRLLDELRDRPDFGDPLDRIWAAIDQTTPLIDGGDILLLANLREIDRRFEVLRPDVRAIGLTGIAYFAEVADAQRIGFLATLRRVTWLVVALVLALSATALVLWRQSRISRRNAAAAELSSSRMAAVVGSSLDAVIVADVGGTVLQANAAVEEVFGFRPEDLVGRKIGDTVVPPRHRAAHRAGMARFTATGAPHIVGKGRIQLEAQRRDGATFPVELSISRAESAQGPIFVSFLRDISRRLAAERELRQARDAARADERAKTRMLAVMSHEMRTPLNGIVGSVDLLQDAGLDPAQARLVAVIRSSAEVLRSHVDDVLDIARLDSDRMVARRDVFRLDSMLVDLVESQQAHARSLGNALALETPRGPATVRGDEARLRQILLNLVGNALKFTDAGQVTVEAERLTGGDLVEFRVIDTGIGIPEDQLDRIFEDFVTLDNAYDRSRGGTGLGLGIVRRMVRHLGGEIGVESELGEGSLFWVRVPLPRAAPDAVPVAARAPGTDDTAPQTVLLVEDNPVNRLLAATMLGRLGHRVTQAEDGAEAVRIAAATRFDLILMDISMPRMDGVTAARKIRTGGASAAAPIVALTAHAMPAEIARFRAAGMARTIVKPVTRAALAEAIAEATGQAPLAGAPAAGPGPSEHGAAPEVDLTALRDLEAETGADRLRGLVRAFLADTDAAVALLSGGAACELPDAELIARIHRASGSAAMFGARALRAALAGLEERGKSGAVAEVRDRLPELADIWQAQRAAYVAVGDAGLPAPDRPAGLVPSAEPGGTVPPPS